MDNADKAFEPLGASVTFGTAKVGDHDVEVVQIERGPGNVTSFPVDEEAYKDDDGKIVTYGEKYAAYRDAPAKKEAAPHKENGGPSPQDHLYPRDSPKTDKKAKHA